MKLHSTLLLAVLVCAGYAIVLQKSDGALYYYKESSSSACSTWEQCDGFRICVKGKCTGLPRPTKTLFYQTIHRLKAAQKTPQTQDLKLRTMLAMGWGHAWTGNVQGLLGQRRPKSTSTKKCQASSAPTTMSKHETIFATGSGPAQATGPARELPEGPKVISITTSKRSTTGAPPIPSTRTTQSGTIFAMGRDTATSIRKKTGPAKERSGSRRLSSTTTTSHWQIPSVLWVPKCRIKSPGTTTAMGCGLARLMGLARVRRDQPRVPHICILNKAYWMANVQGQRIKMAQLPPTFVTGPENVRKAESAKGRRGGQNTRPTYTMSHRMGSGVLKTLQTLATPWRTTSAKVWGLARSGLVPRNSPASKRHILFVWWKK